MPRVKDLLALSFLPCIALALIASHEVVLTFDDGPSSATTGN